MERRKKEAIKARPWAQQESAADGDKHRCLPSEEAPLIRTSTDVSHAQGADEVSRDQHKKSKRSRHDLEPREEAVIMTSTGLSRSGRR